jgi:hypothetical protein
MLSDSGKLRSTSCLTWSKKNCKIDWLYFAPTFDEYLQQLQFVFSSLSLSLSQSGWPDWTNFRPRQFFITEVVQIIGLLFSTVKVVHQLWHKMGWATFWAIFFRKLVRSPCSPLSPAFSWIPKFERFNLLLRNQKRVLDFSGVCKSAFVSGTDVMILKIFSPKNLACFSETTYLLLVFAKKWS